WTYNQGVILGGLTDLYRSTGDRSYLDEAQLIANAATKSLVNSNGILVEPCEPSCGGDGPQFKGIFMRNLWYLYKFDHDPAYLQFIQTNVQSIWANDRNSQNQLGLTWAGPFDSADAARQSSAMDALNAAIPTGPVPDATASLSSTQVTVAPGSSQTVTLGLQNLTNRPVLVHAGVSAPPGISVTPSQGGGALRPNGQDPVTLRVSASSRLAQNFYTIPVSVQADGVKLPTRYLTVLVAAPASILRDYNNTGISSDSDQLTGDFDGLGYSYSAQALAGAGLTPGATVTENGTKLTWPVSKAGFPDNIQADGQTIPVTAPTGTAQIGFLGAAAGGPSQGEVTLNYSDGSTANFDLSLSDWTLNVGADTPSAGNTQAAKLSVRNCDCGTQQSLGNYVFYTGLPVDTGKTLSSITLPISADQGTLHVFSIGTSSQALSGPIVDGIQPATADAGQQVTISGSGFGASQGGSSVGFTDSGVTWGASAGPAAVQVDSWSDTSVAFTVPSPSGTGDEWHVVPGSEATVSVVTAGGATSNAAILEITPSSNPADYFDNIGISPDDDQACANMDGDGFSLSANALAADNITPGGSVAGDGLTFTWPDAAACSNDNILAAGQTMLVPGASGDTTLGVLGTSTSGTSSGTLVIHYTDGSITTQTLTFNDWAGGPSGSDTAVATMPYRNSDGGSSQTLNMYVYVTTVPVDSTKTVESITFPDISDHVGASVTAMHIFAVAIGS
ncbi:MAG TPA: glycoside hydrolase family 76 protein, partial [Candidatus Dormibacteraeota bacterium]|nr:glycoside hydrolase family 76 protein [Candidatus Dormibacteraeota bacterium]